MNTVRKLLLNRCRLGQKALLQKARMIAHHMQKQFRPSAKPGQVANGLNNCILG